MFLTVQHKNGVTHQINTEYTQKKLTKTQITCLRLLKVTKTYFKAYNN